MDKILLLPQSLSAGQAQRTFNDSAPQGSGHREKAASGLLHSVSQNQVLFLSEAGSQVFTGTLSTTGQNEGV